MHPLERAHRDLLASWRKVMNLVGPGPLDPHFDDCKRAMGWLQPAGHWVDLGSGAGFPGLVLAAMNPELRVTLVESRSKRSAFLRRVLAEAAHPSELVDVVQGRVEALPHATFDGVVARAFAKPPATLDHAFRVLKPGGLVILFLQEETQVPSHDGFESVHVETYAHQGSRRRSVALRKLAPV
jgi:16S rRNA (guanine527-N7)-methyltransferase